MFRGKKRSSSTERNYMSVSTGGWHTRTDKNLAHSRRGRNSSSEDDLPSTLMRKARLTEQTEDNSSVAGGSVTGGSKRLTKRNSVQQPSKSRASPAQDMEGSKYTVIERPPREELVRRGTHPKRAANLSTESGQETARETAANTVSNSGATSSRRASMPAERSAWGTTSQGVTIRNRLQHDNGTSGLNTLENRTAELSKLSERLKRLEENDLFMRTSKDDENAPLTLFPPPQLEEVKAPPSITQTPPLFYPTSSASYGVAKSASPRTSSFMPSADSGTRGTESPAIRPSRLGSLDLHAPPNGGSTLKPRGSLSSKDVPLKSALKSPNRAAAPLPVSPSILVSNHKRSNTLAGDTFQFPDRSGAISPPTPSGARDGLKANGDSLFVPKSTSTPPTTSSILVPTPRRLSEIPASGRNSVAMTDDDESIYESATEEFGGIEEEEGKDSDRTETPPVGNALSNIAGRLQYDEPGSSRSTPVSMGDEAPNPNASASTSSTSASTQRRKSVRMIIYPTVALSPPDRYADEPLTPGAEDVPPTTSSTTSTSSIRQTNAAQSGGGPEAWETRIDSSRNAWEDSSEEDEDYGRAKRALARASDPYSDEKRTRRA
jgi:hypothetical protein